MQWKMEYKYMYLYLCRASDGMLVFLSLRHGLKSAVQDRIDIYPVTYLPNAVSILCGLEDINPITYYLMPYLFFFSHNIFAHVK